MENMEEEAQSLDSAEAKDHLACHGMQPNHLFGDYLEIPTKEATAAVLETPTKIYPEIPPRRRKQRTQQEY